MERPLSVAFGFTEHRSTFYQRLDEVTSKNYITLIIATLSERRRATLICLCEERIKYVHSGPPLIFYRKEY
jgi:hypothetical protein